MHVFSEICEKRSKLGIRSIEKIERTISVNANDFFVQILTETKIGQFLTIFRRNLAKNPGLMSYTLPTVLCHIILRMTPFLGGHIKKKLRRKRTSNTGMSPGMILSVY